VTTDPYAGSDVVGTRAEAAALAAPPLLVLENVQEYFDRMGFGEGPLEWSRIGDGQSNVTYRIGRGADQFVLRRGPRPPFHASAHNMVREARVQRELAVAGVPVPDILAICSDESVLGVPFYVMGFIDGSVITDAIPPALDAFGQRRATSESAIDALVALHSVEVTDELGKFGKPGGYLERQLNLFSAIWEATATRSVPEVSAMAHWLRQNMPQSHQRTVVHGDFRLGNLMFARDAPARVRAILDWEMATLGDPLADLGYFTATYTVAGDAPTPMDLTPVTAEPGYLTRAELVDRYQQQMSLDLSELHWYQALGLWKAAVFCEGLYRRWLRQERPDGTKFGPSLEQGVPALLEAARSYAAGDGGADG
jgi:aminoglycoside phosphotransferase (APT) family kinase protein